MPELRKDPIVGRWVIISTERSKRPSDFPHGHSQGKVALCVFCPGNEGLTPAEVLAFRDDGSKPNEIGWKVRVVPNKFPALRIEGPMGRRGEGLYDMMNGIGAHEVIIESVEHDRGVADLEPTQIERVLWAYRDRVLDLSKDMRFRYLLIFKNHGAEAGASLEHPHSQLIALPIVPLSVQQELQGARDYYSLKERCIFCDIVDQESHDRRRLIFENEGFVVVAPFASRFPFELLLLPKNHGSQFENIDTRDYHALAEALRAALRALKLALHDPPFNYIIHSAPLRDGESKHYHWHLEVTPALTKVAGFEVGTGFYINPMPPEDAATHLRQVLAEQEPSPKAAVAS
jgi:UDPglucose--hexose-1-phosphate uridylyltransferase